MRQTKGSIIIATLILFGVISTSTTSLLTLIRHHIQIEKDRQELWRMQLESDSVAYSFTHHLKDIPLWPTTRTPTLSLDKKERYHQILSPEKTAYFLTRTPTKLYVWALYVNGKTRLTIRDY